MKLIYDYFGQILKIGDFYIKIGEKINLEDNYIPYNKNNYIPYNYDSFITNEQFKVDFKLSILNSKEDESSITRKLYDNIYEEESNYIFDYDYSPHYHLRYCIRKDWKEWSLVKNDISFSDKFNNLTVISNDTNEIITNNPNSNIFDWCNILGNIFAYSILNRDAIVLHGVIIEYEGRGIIISAKSGTGKTTHARLWRDYKNAIIINGDRAICRQIGNTWYAYGSPWSGTSGESINRSVPIKAIVMLEQSIDNNVEELSPYEASLKLIERVFAPTWEVNLMNKAFDIIDNIVNDIPLLKLKCTPDKKAVEVLEEAMNKL